MTLSPIRPATPEPPAGPEAEVEAGTDTGPAGRPRPPRGGLLRLTPADRDVLWLYALTRAALWLTAYCAARLFPADPATRHAAPALAPWRQWDWAYYLHIARDGYFPSGPGGAARPGVQGWDNREAFFPGFPLLLRAVHTVVPSWTAAGLAVSLVAGAVAVMALARIAGLEQDGGPGRFGGDGGRMAARLFLLSPCAVFLAAGYTEALFLALALPAWLAARRGSWPLAAALACGACAVRVSGLFLAAALAALLLTTARSRRDLRPAPWLALPALPPLLYTVYLHRHTGDWMAWKHAEDRGWYRNFHAPWTAWHHTWTAAFDSTQTTAYAIEFQSELLGMLVGLALLVALLLRRRWPEALYVALTLWALGTSYWYMSVPRATLLWWPLWTSLGAAALTRPRLRAALLCLAAPCPRSSPSPSSPAAGRADTRLTSSHDRDPHRAPRAVELEREQWAIYAVWRVRCTAGTVTPDSHPGGGGIDARYDALTAPLAPHRQALAATRRFTAQWSRADGTRGLVEGVGHGVRWAPAC